MGGNKSGVRRCLQNNLQKVVGVKSENGAAIGGEIANMRQTLGEFFRIFQRRHKDKIVNLACFSSAFINRTDFCL